MTFSILLNAVGFLGSLLTFGWLLKGCVENFTIAHWKKLKNWEKILLCSAFLLALMCALEVVYGFSQKLMWYHYS